MARRPFNPDEALGGLFDQPPEPTADAAPEPPAPLTPSLLNDRIKRVLESGLGGSIRLTGELSNLNRRGHWYFAVKDEDSVVSCVMWRSDAARVDFEPKDGESVLVTGRVSHWVPGGRTQFYATAMKREGLGTLEERFQALCDELRRAGYFDESRKRRLPAMPRRIAVVTSASGAAVEDVRRTAANRFPGVDLLVVDVRVQGEGAAPEIARAIGRLDAAADRLGIDAILVTRGGGSREDLWAFNERVVADAAFRCRTPLVAAIGHEVDTSVIELIADLRASTPTQAAVHLVPDATELGTQVAYQADRLRTALRTRMAVVRQRFEAAPTRLGRALVGTLARQRLRLAELETALESNRPAARVSAARARVELLDERLRTAVRSVLRTATNRVEAAGRQLGGVGPRAVLARGYAWTIDERGGLVRSIEDAPVGSRLTTILADGRVHSTVETTQQEPGSDVDRSGPRE